jgi:diaminopimelate epimerase
MTGSGNDFVCFDARDVPLSRVSLPEVISSICNRYNGIGADGIVLLEQGAPTADVRIHYFNRDGTPADLCGNATLCSTALSAGLALGSQSGMTLETPSGLIASRIADGLPEIDLLPVTSVRTTMPIDLVAGEHRIGYATAGIPHLVILCADADLVDVAGRGPLLRRHEASGLSGANVNWVSPRPDGRWRSRTFERGVEGETQACGTGAVATAVLLAAWGYATDEMLAIRTSSGRDLQVRLSRAAHGYRPTLRGEGRIVYQGTIASLG